MPLWRATTSSWGSVPVECELLSTIGRAARVVALRKTCLACPSQWEGTLGDGRVVYARYRHGALSVGVGDDIDQAIRNGMSDHALYADYVGDGFDGFMDFEELRDHLHGLLEFPPKLVVENERPQLEVS